jgi:hypothetical protein
MARGSTRTRSPTSRHVVAPAARRRADDEGRFLVAVTFRIGRFGVPVITEFISPGPRTIVMRIVDGEGSGSLVETHATPLGPDRDRRPLTAVLEAVIAHPDRTGYRAFDAPLP